MLKSHDARPCCNLPVLGPRSQSKTRLWSCWAVGLCCPGFLFAGYLDCLICPKKNEGIIVAFKTFAYWNRSLSAKSCGTSHGGLPIKSYPTSRGPPVSLPLKSFTGILLPWRKQHLQLHKVQGQPGHKPAPKGRAHAHARNFEFRWPPPPPPPKSRQPSPRRKDPKPRPRKKKPTPQTPPRPQPLPPTRKQKEITNPRPNLDGQLES